MVTPEPSGPEEPKRNGAVAVAVLGLAAGLVSLIGLTQPDPPPTTEATVSTDTTVAAPAVPSTTVDFVPQGEPLQFEVVDIDGQPLAMMQSDTGEIILVTADWSYGGATNLQTFASEDGISWESLGSPVSSEADVSWATVTPIGMILHGQNESGAPTIWTSRDGRSWSTHVVDPEGRWSVEQVAASEDLILAVGSGGIWEQLENALVARVGEIGHRFSVYTEDSEDPEILVHSPLGIPLARYTVDDLGFNPFQLIGEDERQVRASVDGTDWYDATMPESGYGGELITGRDGELFSVRHEDLTSRLSSTIDGLTWTERGDTRRMGARVQPWRGDLLSISQSLWVGTSVDGGEWSRSVTLRDLFHQPNAWSVPAMATGDAGIVAVAARVREFEQTPPDATIDVEKDGWVVRVGSGSLYVFNADRQTVAATISLWGSTVSSSVAYDADAGTVTIHGQPEAGPVVTFTLEELEELEAQVQTANASHPDIQSVLLTSADGCAWTSQELDLPELTNVESATVVGNRFALTIGSVLGLGEAQLWWGTLPDPGDPSDCSEE